MKSFNQFLTEAENSIPLDLSEAVEWFSIFDEELFEVDKIEVLEELSEEDLINLAWIKEYLYEAELIPGAANKKVKFNRSNPKPKFKRPNPKPKSANPLPDPWEGSYTTGKSDPPKANQKVTPNSQQYTGPVGPQRAVSDLKISKSGLEAARDVARGRETLPPPPPGVKRAPWELNNKNASQKSAPASTSRLRQSLSNLSSKIKSKLPPQPSASPGGRFAGVKNFIGRAAVPVTVAFDTGIETAAQKSRGRRTGSALAMGATKPAGGLAGMKAGAAGGAAIGSLAGPIGAAVGGVVGGIGGYYTGSNLAGKASETVAGATGKEKTAMATANRQRQAGGGLAGIGGQTTFSKGKDGTGFMSTGVGNQRKTVQLAKTSVVKDPKTGKLETGNLAFKDGKAVYKRAADPSTLAQTSSNPLERVGRSLFAGAYKQQDEKARQARLAQAVQSDIKRQRELGVKGSQNLVGPKIVGPKIVGPKPTPSKPAGGGMGGRRGGGSSPGSIKPTTK